MKKNIIQALLCFTLFFNESYNKVDRKKQKELDFTQYDIKYPKRTQLGHSIPVGKPKKESILGTFISQSLAEGKEAGVGQVEFKNKKVTGQEINRDYSFEDNTNHDEYYQDDLFNNQDNYYDEEFDEEELNNILKMLSEFDDSTEFNY